MTNTYNIKYRKAIYNLLHHLKSQVGESKFTELMEQMEEKLECVPTNDLEQSKKFFKEMSHSILSVLNDYYTITYTEVERASASEDKFEFAMREDMIRKSDAFSKYAKMPRFMNGFLTHQNYTFYQNVQRNGRNELSKFNDFRKNDETQKFELFINRINHDDDLKLPKNDSSYIGSRWSANHFITMDRIANLEKERLDEINQNYEQLIELVEEFERKIEASLKKETIQFAVQNIRQILTNIMIPVSLIEDENLRILCEENGRKLFVKNPTLDDLMPIGTSVYVYSSHDLDDDSSYVAKPILLTDELPKDTEELKYHGVGQYTGYDSESERSLGGDNPYVINGNIYVKLNPAEFEAIIPEELQEDIAICKEIMKKNYTEVGSSENNAEKVGGSENNYTISDLGYGEKLKRTIELVYAEKSESIQEFVEHFIAAANGVLEEKEEVSVSDSEAFEKERFEEKRDIHISDALYTKHPLHPDGYTILFDEKGNYSFIRKLGQKGKVQVFITKDLDECCRAGGLTDGIYSIYNFLKCSSTRGDALIKLYLYKA